MSEELKERLNELVAQCGTDRRAVKHIQRIKGYAPTHSAIFKARTSGTGTDYVIASYVADLQSSLDIPAPTSWQAPDWCEGLSERTAMCLSYFALYESKKEIKMDMARLGESHFLNIRNFGLRSLAELTEWLK
ncbi:hypothetical protein [Pseudoalteromonas rubra]|uniref:hypothetical protein n=1 Tax=Pseudoalteromonas rubra TaxID=43658 RepID=UPI002DBE01F5|nr:hypothetical protein [Pseudoalteromonas rubra]MEC4091613.1 hypothetical protein [Pseudoalteromonas rubra]